MVKHVFNNVIEASDYIQSLFPSRGSHAHFFSEHISNRGKEAYEFNIKCCIKTAPWVEKNWNNYYIQIADELRDYVVQLKDTFDWIDECFTAGRMGGWLVVTTYDRVFEDWEDSEIIMDVGEVIKRANELYTISEDIKQNIKELETMSNTDVEEYWGWCKPDDWEDQVEEGKRIQQQAFDERMERQRIVVNYTPGDTFYYLETTHRKYILNDRGDIISTFDKMMRGDSWRPYGQVPNGNCLVGWNRIKYFSQDGIAPKRVSFVEAVKGKHIRGLSLVVYNAPSGRLEYYGETVEYMYTIDKDSLKSYGFKNIA